MHARGRLCTHSHYSILLTDPETTIKFESRISTPNPTPTTMGGTKRKICLDQKLEKKSAIKTTFTKRRKTLFNKSQELCHVLPQSQVSVAAIVFSPGGKPYVFSYPPDHPADSLFDSFLRASAPAPEAVRPPSPYSFAVGGGSGSGGTPFAAPSQEMNNNNKGTEKMSYQDLEWLSLKDCDTLDKMIAKRDFLLRMGDVIQQTLLSSSSSSTITAAATSMGPDPLTTTDHRLLTSTTEFEDHQQGGQGAGSSSLLDGDGWSTLIQGTTTGGGQAEDYDNPNVDYDMWDRLMIFNDDDVYFDIDSLLC